MEVFTQSKLLNSHCHNTWFHKKIACKTFGKFPTHFCFRHLLEAHRKHIIPASSKFSLSLEYRLKPKA